MTLCACEYTGFLTERPLTPLGGYALKLINHNNNIVFSDVSKLQQVLCRCDDALLSAYNLARTL